MDGLEIRNYKMVREFVQGQTEAYGKNKNIQIRGRRVAAKFHGSYSELRTKKLPSNILAIHHIGDYMYAAKYSNGNVKTHFYGEFGYNG